MNNMSDTTSLIITIIGAMLVYTTSLASFMLWLTSKFNSLEKLIYRETAKHRQANDDELEDHMIRIQRLELHAFGFTNSGPSTTMTSIKQEQNKKDRNQ